MIRPLHFKHYVQMIPDDEHAKKSHIIASTLDVAILELMILASDDATQRGYLVLWWESQTERDSLEKKWIVTVTTKQVFVGKKRVMSDYARKLLDIYSKKAGKVNYIQC